MDDLQYGTRDKRGNWTPTRTLEIAPFWRGKWNEMGHREILSMAMECIPYGDGTSILGIYYSRRGNAQDNLMGLGCISPRSIDFFIEVMHAKLSGH